MNGEKSKKPLSTPVLALIVLAATALALGLVVLFVFVLSGSGGPAKTKLGNQIVATIDAVDELIDEFEATDGCAIDTKAITDKHRRVNQQILVVIRQTFREVTSGEPSQDLIDDSEKYGPQLEARGQKLEQVAVDFAAKCGFDLPDLAV